MRKRSKVLISVLLLMAMLGSMIPATAFVASAANQPTYEYVLADSVQPGKTYIIANGSSGSVNALSVAANAGEGTPVSSIPLTVSGNKIAESSTTAQAEWTVVPGRNAVNSLKATYMLQNPASGAYLYNPVYDVSYGTDGTTPQPMAVTKDPMHDNYSPYSRQSFNSDAAFNAYVGTFNIPASNGGLAVNAGTFVTLSRASTSYDPQVIFKFSANPDSDGGLAVNNGVVNGYQMGGFTAHNVGIANNDMEFYQMFSGAANGSHIGGRVANLTNSGNLPTGQWNFIEIPSAFGQADATAVYTGSVKYIRFDVNSGSKIHVAYVYLAGNPHARVALDWYTKWQADQGGSGFYPSQRFPFAQFCISGAQNATIGNFDVNRNMYSQMFYYGWSGANFLRGWNGQGEALGKSYFFEKREVTGATSTWTTVSSASDLVNGEIYTMDNGATSYILHKTGDSFFLQRVSDGKIYAANPDGSIAHYDQVDAGGTTASYGTRFVWNYSSGTLTGSTYAQNAGETPATTAKSVTLKRLTYHEHTGTFVRTVPATCTEGGYDLYHCSSCGQDYKLNETDPAGHLFGAWTQTAEGHSRTCTRAGCGYTESAAHEMGSWVMTEGLDGTHSRACSVCGYTVSGGHTFTSQHHEGNCSVPGYTIYNCTTCGYQYRQNDASTTGNHDLDPGTLVTEPTCTTDGVLRRTCKLCGVYTEDVVLPAHGHFYGADGKCQMAGCNAQDNTYVEQGDIRYYYVDKPEDGRTYAIANKNTTGSGYIASATPGDGADAHDTDYLQSVPTTIARDGDSVFGTYVTNVGLTSQWKYNNKSFFNEKTTEYLWGRKAATGDYEEWIHHNIGSDEALFTFQSIVPAKGTVGNQSVNSGVGTQILGSDGQYLDFKDVVSTKGFTIPGEGMYQFTTKETMTDGGEEYERLYLPVAGYTDQSGNYFTPDIPAGHYIDPSCTIDFDFAMSDSSSLMTIMRPDTSLGTVSGVRIVITNGYVFAITPSKATSGGAVNAGAQYAHSWDTVGQLCVGYAQIPGFTYGNDVWHHFRIDSTLNSTEKNCKIYVDGALVLTVNDWAFYTPDNTAEANYFVNGNNEVVRKFFTLFGWSWINPAGIGLPASVMAELGFGDVNYSDDSHDNRVRPFSKGDSATTVQHLQGDTFVDNLYAVSKDTGFQLFDTFDKVEVDGRQVNNGNVFYQSPTAKPYTTAGSGTINADGVIAQNVFIADSMDTNRLYLYEKRFGTTVEYYVDGELDSTDKVYKPVGDTFSSVDKTPAGAHLETIVVNGTDMGNTSPTQSAEVTTTGNTIKVYYETNATYTYTVRYFKDDVSTTEPFTTYTGGPTEATTITYGTPVYPDYLPTGYELGEYSPTVTINTANQVIDVHYVRVQISYTVLYYINGTLDGTLTENKAVPYGTAVTYGTDNYPNKCPVDYHLVSKSADIPSITGTTTLEVYYAIDTVNYKIEYSFDGEYDPNEDVTGTANKGDEIPVPDKKPFGYDPDPTNPETPIIATDTENVQVIRINYNQAVFVAPVALALDYAEIDVPTSYAIEKTETSENYTIAFAGISEVLDQGASTNKPYTSARATIEDVTFDGFTATYADDLIAVTATKTDFEAKFIAVYTVSDGTATGYIYQDVTFVPATTIYFEDTNPFVKYSAGWSETPAVAGLSKAILDDVYGGSETLNESATLLYSGGTSHYFDIVEYDDDSRNAEFTFTGTGFDVISHCGYNTGIVFVDLYDKDDNFVKGYVVDTFTGYKYENGKWQKTSDGDAVYQVPIIHITGLDYDTYKAVITPVYDRSYAHANDSLHNGVYNGAVEIVDGEVVATRFWLDAVRIYEPAKESDVANGIYVQDNESNYKVFKIGDIMKYDLAGSDIVVDEENDDFNASVGSAVYFVGQPAGKKIFVDYSTFGPKNEVYLKRKNHFVSFTLNAGDSIPAKVLIAGSALGGTAMMNVNNAVVKEIETGTDMYYDFTNAVTWELVDGNYQATIVINNAQGAEGTLVLTNIKLCKATSDTWPEVEGGNALVVRRNAEEFYADALAIIKANTIAGDVNGDGVINLKDTALLKKLISGAEEFDFFASLAADMNGDGTFNVRDVNSLKAAVAGN